MRKIIILQLVMIAIMSSGCGNCSGKNNIKSGFQLSDTGTVKIAFKEYEYNFGKVTEGEKIAHLFTFENKGTANLVLTSVETSCGCTVPKFNKKPVVPGGNGKLEVFFNTSGRNGMQTKTITVKSNASSPVVLLKITAEVVNNNK